MGQGSSGNTRTLCTHHSRLLFLQPSAIASLPAVSYVSVVRYSVRCSTGLHNRRAGDRRAGGEGVSENVWKGGREGGRAGGEGTEGRERGVEERGASQQRQCGVTAMNRLQPSAGDRRFGLERERVGTGERGEGGPPPCAAPARCCPRAASRPFLPSNRTHPRAPTHTYSALRTHLFTLDSAENRRTRTPSRRAPATSVGNPPVPNPGGRARPRAGPVSVHNNTSSARRRRHSPPRARDACPHAHKDPTLSHTRSLYTHIL